MIYLSYFLGNIVIMRARLRGWPKTRAPFRLGRWGMLVNIVALVYGGAMLVNFAWPRAASNPKANQTNGLLHLNFLDGSDLVDRGDLHRADRGDYYLVVGRTKAFAPVVSPSEDDAPLAGTGAAPPHDPPTVYRTADRIPAAARIVREAGITVHAQIEDWLAGQIATGALAAGDRLPTEQDLAKWFGVSRMTLRHALAELARRGLVTRTVGRHGGTVVAAAKLEQDLTTLAGFSEQLRRHGMVAGARVLSARGRAAGPAAGAALRLGATTPCTSTAGPAG